MKNQLFTDITSGPEARTKILNGVNAVANVVGSTQGYRGRFVLLEKNGLPYPTQDGFDVSETIFREDKVESLACETAKEASRKTADEVGDGTSATMVLLQAFLQNSYKELENGTSPIDIKENIEKSKDLIIEYLKEISVDLTEDMIFQLARTSAHGDEKIAQLVADAYKQAGENGSVGHTRSNNDDTFIEHHAGTLVERGYAHEVYVNVKSKQQVLFDDSPLVLISNISFSTIKQIEPFLNYCADNKRQLVIISEMDYAIEEVIMTNVAKHKFPFAVVKCPSIGKKREELLSDLALVCGSQMITSTSGADFYGREEMFLGLAKSVTITKENTIVEKDDSVDNAPIIGKVAELKENLKLVENNYVWRKNIEERIAKLSGGVAMIKVGGITPAEVEEKIARVDDAVCAVRSAREEGVLAGGGTALFSAFKKIQGLDEVTKKAIQAPFYKILRNASFYPHFVEAKEKFKINWWSRPIMIDVSCFEVPKIEYPFGYDVKEFKEVNMFDAGIIDSTKAIRNALVNAISASNTLLMTENIVTLNKS